MQHGPLQQVHSHREKLWCEVWTGLNVYALSCQQSSALVSVHPAPTTASFTHHCMLKPVCLNAIENFPIFQQCSTSTTVFSRSLVGAMFVQLAVFRTVHAQYSTTMSCFFLCFVHMTHPFHTLHFYSIDGIFFMKYLIQRDEAL